MERGGAGVNLNGDEQLNFLVKPSKLIVSYIVDVNCSLGSPRLHSVALVCPIGYVSVTSGV